MVVRLRSRVSATVVVLLLASCSNAKGSGAAAGFATPAAVATAIGCTDFSAGSGKMSSNGDGSCTYNSENVDITTFTDTGQRNQYVSIGKKTGCAVAKGLGLSHFYMVEGPNWIAQPDSHTTQAALATKLGGKSLTIDC